MTTSVIIEQSSFFVDIQCVCTQAKLNRGGLGINERRRNVERTSSGTPPRRLQHEWPSVSFFQKTIFRVRARFFLPLDHRKL